ncbi:MAG: class II glutamine amidotransferase [Granulosicoccus sp.]
MQARDGRFQPVGTTDNEYAFCWILNGLQKEIESLPDDHSRFTGLHYADSVMKAD